MLIKNRATSTILQPAWKALIVLFSLCCITFLILICICPDLSNAAPACGALEKLPPVKAEHLPNPSLQLITEPYRKAIRAWEATSATDVDGLIPMSFKFSLPKTFGGLHFILMVQPIGQLVSTDSFYCLDSEGTPKALFTDFEKYQTGKQHKVEFDVEASDFPTIAEQARKGELQCVLQDDTALFSAHMKFYSLDMYEYYKRIIVDEDTGFALEDGDKTRREYPRDCSRQVADAFLRLMKQGYDVPERLRDVLSRTLRGSTSYYLELVNNLGEGLGDNNAFVRYFRHRDRIAGGKSYEFRKTLMTELYWANVGLVLLSPEVALFNQALTEVTEGPKALYGQGDEAAKACFKLLLAMMPTKNKLDSMLRIAATELIDGLKENPKHYWDVDLPNRENFLELDKQENQYRSEFEYWLADVTTKRVLLDNMDRFTNWVEREYPDVLPEQWAQFAANTPQNWSEKKKGDIRIAAAIAKTHTHDLEFKLFYVKQGAKPPLKQTVKEQKEKSENKLLEARDRYFAAHFLLGYKDAQPPGK